MQEITRTVEQSEITTNEEEDIQVSYNSDGRIVFMWFNPVEPNIPERLIVLNKAEVDILLSFFRRMKFSFNDLPF